MAKQNVQIMLIRGNVTLWDAWMEDQVAQKVSKLGGVTEVCHHSGTHYTIHVDPRFDLDQLAQEIKALVPATGNGKQPQSWGRTTWHKKELR